MDSMKNVTPDLENMIKKNPVAFMELDEVSHKNIKKLLKKLKKYMKNKKDKKNHHHSHGNKEHEKKHHHHHHHHRDGKNHHHKKKNNGEKHHGNGITEQELLNLFEWDFDEKKWKLKKKILDRVAKSYNDCLAKNTKQWNKNQFNEVFMERMEPLRGQTSFIEKRMHPYIPHVFDESDTPLGEELNDNASIGKGLTSRKAREILHDGHAHGKPLTDKQRRFFGAISSGETPYKNVGTYISERDGYEDEEYTRNMKMVMNQIGKHLTRDKAATILHEGKANKHELTDKQRRYFAWVAYGQHGPIEMALNSLELSRDEMDGIVKTVGQPIMKQIWSRVENNEPGVHEGMDEETRNFIGISLYGNSKHKRTNIGDDINVQGERSVEEEEEEKQQSKSVTDALEPEEPEEQNPETILTYMTSEGNPMAITVKMAKETGLIPIHKEGNVWLTQYSGDIPFYTPNKKWVYFVDPDAARNLGLLLPEGESSYIYHMSLGESSEEARKNKLTDKINRDEFFRRKSLKENVSNTSEVVESSSSSGSPTSSANKPTEKEKKKMTVREEHDLLIYLSDQVKKINNDTPMKQYENNILNKIPEDMMVVLMGEHENPHQGMSYMEFKKNLGTMYGQFIMGPYNEMETDSLNSFGTSALFRLGRNRNFFLAVPFNMYEKFLQNECKITFPVQKKVEKLCKITLSDHTDEWYQNNKDCVDVYHDKLKKRISDLEKRLQDNSDQFRDKGKHLHDEIAKLRCEIKEVMKYNQCESMLRKLSGLMEPCQVERKQICIPTPPPQPIDECRTVLECSKCRRPCNRGFLQSLQCLTNPLPALCNACTPKPKCCPPPQVPIVSVTKPNVPCVSPKLVCKPAHNPCQNNFSQYSDIFKHTQPYKLIPQQPCPPHYSQLTKKHQVMKPEYRDDEFDYTCSGGNKFSNIRGQLDHSEKYCLMCKTHNNEMGNIMASIGCHLDDNVQNDDKIEKMKDIPIFLYDPELEKMIQDMFLQNEQFEGINSLISYEEVINYLIKIIMYSEILSIMAHNNHMNEQ